jgi:hypothetical protein
MFGSDRFCRSHELPASHPHWAAHRIAIQRESRVSDIDGDRGRVEVENLVTGAIQHTSSAYLTFVALDKNGSRLAIPPVIPETKDEKRRYEEAEERRTYRLAMREKALQKRR